MVIGVATFPLATEIRQVVMIAVGMLMMAAFSALSRHVHGVADTGLLQISFNEGLAREAMHGPTSLYAQSRLRSSGLQISERPWDPNAHARLRQDPIMALARLRLDLEERLRRIVYENHLDVDPRNSTIDKLTSILVKQGLLSFSVLIALEQVLSACNAAIHGAAVNSELAASILDIGYEILEILPAQNATMDTD
jgi:hypothetical protein